MAHEILGKNLLILIAHPDDESFLASGTMHANKQNGGKNYILCASKGELGYSYLTSVTSIAKIKEIRKRELLNASSCVGVDMLEILDLPDGSLNDCVEILETHIMKFALANKFDYVMSFGEDGYTGHNDHVAISHIARRVAKMYKVPFLQFAKIPEHICGDFDARFFAKRKNGKYIDGCQGDVVANLKIEIDPSVKLKSLQMHESQFAGLDPHKIFPPEIAEHFLRYEYFFVSNP